MDKIKQVTLEEENYPFFLRMIAQPPKILYYRGDISLASRQSIAIVGARKATPYGKWAAAGLAKKLVDYDIVVVSGMASGIDGFAHRGALDNGGKTVAVLGCGVDVCYPAEHKELMKHIAKDGLLLSEFAPGTAPLPFRFPMRNRIVSGLCAGIVVVEAGISSGALITAECAAEQGRNIYAVPGNINNVYSMGANKLIQDGATPLIVFDDIIEGLGIEKKEWTPQSTEKLGRDEQLLCDYLYRRGETTKDQLCEGLQKSPAQINALVTILEMKGIVQTSIGKIYIAK